MRLCQLQLGHEVVQLPEGIGRWSLLVSAELVVTLVASFGTVKAGIHFRYSAYFDSHITLPQAALYGTKASAERVHLYIG